MSGLNLYLIRDKALETKRSVFSIQQLSHLIGKSKAIAKVYASRLVSKELASQVIRGKITFVKDEYVTANQLIEPSYISCRTALVFHGLITQVPERIECCCTSNSRIYAHLGITYHKVSSLLFFGFKKMEKSGSYIFMADAEKALIDSVYLNLIPKNHVRQLVSNLNQSMMCEYVSRYFGRGKKKLTEWLSC